MATETLPPPNVRPPLAQDFITVSREAIDEMADALSALIDAATTVQSLTKLSEELGADSHQTCFSAIEACAELQHLRGFPALSRAHILLKGGQHGK